MADIGRSGKRYQSQCCPHKTDPAERYIAAKRPETARSDLAALPNPHLTSNSGLDDNRQRTREAVAACGTTLTETFGISDVLAAKIIGHTGPINRFASADAYANYTGTAPIEVSSGGKVRHRLSRAGNRQLNSAIHLAAHVQRLHPGQGRDYYLRKIDEGKTPKEALRCLKRQVTKAVYRALKADAERAVTAHLDTAC